MTQIKIKIWLFILLLFIIAFYINAKISYGSYDKPKITYENITKNLKVKPSKAFYIELKNQCYANKKVKNKKHCIKVGLAINYAESSFKSFDLGLQSKDKSVKIWVKKYAKRWFKAKDGAFFYGKDGKNGPSFYCMSEHSSNSKGWCPNGGRNFNSIFFNIK